MANGVICLRQTKKEMAQYLSGWCMNSTTSTLLRSIRRNHFQPWPRMITKLISKHLPKCIITAKGHLDQEQKSIRYTKILPSLFQDYKVLKQEPNILKFHNTTCTVIEARSLHKSYSDQPSKFPVKSLSNNQYIFMMYHFDTSIIHAVPIKSRRTEDIDKAWQEIFDSLQLNGHAPIIHVLEKECSSDLNASFKRANVNF